MKHMIIAIPDDLKDRVKNAANKNYKTLSEMVRSILLEYLENHGG